MSFEGVPNFFWLGPQKAASTWAYHCFLEHPEIYVPEYQDNLKGIGGDTIRYYTIHYHRGPSWYRQFYEDYAGEVVSGDTTPSYLRSEVVPARIAGDVPDAKLIVCLRHPVDRAYSHYWHEKKKNKIRFDFDEVLENHDLYENWIVPGFYARHLERYTEYFSNDQILVVLMKDLIEDDRSFIRNVFSFLNVDETFEPSVLGKRVNRADYRQTPLYQGYQISVGMLERANVKRTVEWIKTIPGFESLKSWVFGRREYKDGMSEAIRGELLEIFKPQNRALESMIDRDLSHWNR